ncbi:MAG: hypothetical protein ACYDCL_13685 [Myxococcales bacterium]
MTRRKQPIHLEAVREAHRMLDAAAQSLDDLTPEMLARGHRKLDALAREHPEVTAPTAHDRARTEPMTTNEKQVSFRLPADLVERIDAHAERLTEQSPGMTFTRADVVRMLLTRGMAEAEAGGKQKRGK